MRWPWQKKQDETRASGNGFTAEVISARADYLIGRKNLASLTATVQTCITHWEHGFAIADVDGTDLLPPRTLALLGRALAIRGECVFLIGDDGLIACSDWDLSTTDGEPHAYRITLPDAGGGRTMTVLKGEVLHFRIGSDVSAPYAGVAPLRRAQLSAELLAAVETSMRDVYEKAPIGSQVISYPENEQTDSEAISRGFRGNRGSVLLRESTRVVAAGGPAPTADWTPRDLTPDMQKAAVNTSITTAREAIFSVYGILPSLFSSTVAGPQTREAQRHLAQWILTPISKIIAQEASEKLGGTVEIDCLRPLQAFDAGGRARAALGIINAMAAAKDAGLDEAAVTKAFALVDWAHTD